MDFAGIYESISVKETPNGPFKYRYDTKLVNIGTDLIGKMIIGFKKDFRASYLCLENYIEDFEVLEITRDVCKTEFPGYDKVNVTWEELSGLIDTDAWKLRSQIKRSVSYYGFFKWKEICWLCNR